jgi:hypothetical protein
MAVVTDALVESPHRVVRESRHRVKVGNAICLPSIYIVHCNNWGAVSEEDPPSGYNFDDYDYLTLPADKRGSYRNVGGIGLVGEFDNATYYAAPTIMDSDGTWQDWAQDWEWSWASYSQPSDGDAGYGLGPAQDQNRTKIVGPAKGTLVVYDTLEKVAGWGIFMDMGDPINEATLTPLSAEYFVLGYGTVLELYAALPGIPTPTEYGPSASNAIAFRFGKEPSDFPWYPL